MTADPIRAALSAYCEYVPQHAETVGQKAISPRGRAEAAPLIGKPKGELRKRSA